MTVDVTLVLFRPDTALLRRTLAGVAANRSSVRRLRVLHSACAPGDERQVAQLLDDAGLSALAHVEVRGDNLGFAGGHDRLLAAAFDDPAEGGPVQGCLVLNPDCEMAPGALAALLRAAHERVAQPALVGPVLRLRRRGGAASAGAEVVDSLGITWTAAGRHVDDGQGRPLPAALPPARRVAGVSGACLLVSRRAWEVLQRHGGLFDETFVAYREDAELGVRAAAVGVPSFVVAVEGFVHWRNVVGSERGNALADALGARNRLLLRHKLGRRRPGAPLLPTLRDVLVVGAALTVERSSWPAVRQALALRRYVRATGRRALGSATQQPPTQP